MLEEWADAEDEESPTEVQTDQEIIEEVVQSASQEVEEVSI